MPVWDMLLTFLREQLQCVNLVLWTQIPFREGSKTQIYLEKKRIKHRPCTVRPNPSLLSIPPSPVFINRVQFISHCWKKLLSICAHVYINCYIQLNSINRSNPGPNPQAPLGPLGLEGTLCWSRQYNKNIHIMACRNWWTAEHTLFGVAWGSKAFTDRPGVT